MSFDRLLRLLLPAFLLLSCSIKEDRASCPCLLSLDLNDLPVTPVVLDVTGEGYAHTEIVHADTVLVLPVPKGNLAVSAVGGALAEGDGRVRIPVGEEAPPLYLFYADVPALAERVSVPVQLRKQFCVLELVFSGPPGYGPPFEVEVEGDVEGWLRDGGPAPGAFSHRIRPGDDGKAVLRLPRQGDESLRMHIVFADRAVRTFALGSYMAAAGYDWTAPELEDLTLHVDIAVTSVTLSTDLWSQSEETDVWI